MHISKDPVTLKQSHQRPHDLTCPWWNDTSIQSGPATDTIISTKEMILMITASSWNPQEAKTATTVHNRFNSFTPYLLPVKFSPLTSAAFRLTVVNVVILTLYNFMNQHVENTQVYDVWYYWKEQHENKSNKVVVKLLLKPYFDR